MTLGLADIMDAAVTHAAGSGWFDQVVGHEPKSAPGKGISAALWVDSVTPMPGRSGLNSTTVQVMLKVRLACSMTQEPQDAIDPNLLAAADDLMGAYSGDFTLGGLVSHVDLLGELGQGMRGQAGYLNQDGLILRVFVIDLPLVVNDLWLQVP